MNARKILFWGAGGALVYTYGLFPLSVFVRGILRARPYEVADATPSITVAIAAHNEVGTIGKKLENVLSLDYPTDRLEIIVASDGSDDGTDDVIRGFSDRGVQLVSLPRCGKDAALNAAVAAATGDVLVFSDANSMYERGALRALVRPLADRAVGGVAGNQQYVSAATVDSTAVGERNYWSFDRLLKIAQSRSGSVTSATGAIYAMRRALFTTIPPGVTDDFFNTLRVVEAGYRVVFAEDAVAFETVSESSQTEFERKVRVMMRGLLCVFVMRRLLDARQYGFFSIQLLSHKVLMRTMTAPLAIAAVTGPLLWRRGSLYRAAAVGQTCFYSLGAAGLLLARRPIGQSKSLALPAYFCLVNAASARATWALACRRRLDNWEPRRTR